MERAVQKDGRDAVWYHNRPRQSVPKPTMTVILTPYIPSTREAHELDLWTKAECFRFYVSERRATCTLLERMDLWLRAPYCEECILCHPLQQFEPPDMM